MVPITIGVTDFQFMVGVQEKIAHLIEYATNQFLPLIIFQDFIESSRCLKSHGRSTNIYEPDTGNI